jgi:hypothetical protein
MKGEIFSFLPLRLCSFASLRETKLRSVTPIPPQSVTVIKEMIINELWTNLLPQNLNPAMSNSPCETWSEKAALPSNTLP